MRREEEVVLSDEQDDSEMVCPVCGMKKENWTENDGEGYERDGEFYCCEGCAEDSRCSCQKSDDGQAVVAPRKRKRSRR